MYDILFVRGRESVEDLQNDVPCPIPRESSFSAEQVTQALALEKFHDEEGLFVWRTTEICDVDDVLMANARCGSSFLEESCGVSGIAGKFAPEKLDRDLLADDHVFGKVDIAHAAGTDSADKAVFVSNDAIRNSCRPFCMCRRGCVGCHLRRLIVMIRAGVHGLRTTETWAAAKRTAQGTWVFPEIKRLGLREMRTRKAVGRVW